MKIECKLHLFSQPKPSPWLQSSCGWPADKSSLCSNSTGQRGHELWALDQLENLQVAQHLQFSHLHPPAHQQWMITAPLAWILSSAFPYLSCWAHWFICFKKEGLLGILDIISMPEGGISYLWLTELYQHSSDIIPSLPHAPGRTWPSKTPLKYKAIWKSLLWSAIMKQATQVLEFSFSLEWQGYVPAPWIVSRAVFFRDRSPASSAAIPLQLKSFLGTEGRRGL